MFMKNVLWSIIAVSCWESWLEKVKDIGAWTELSWLPGWSAGH